MKPDDTQTLAIRGDYITLGQLVKLLGLVNLGSEARDFLADAGIMVNGEPEHRRGRKLRGPDRIQLPDGQVIIMEGGTPNPEESPD